MNDGDGEDSMTSPPTEAELQLRYALNVVTSAAVRDGGSLQFVSDTMPSGERVGVFVVIGGSPQGDACIAEIEAILGAPTGACDIGAVAADGKVPRIQ